MNKLTSVEEIQEEFLKLAKATGIDLEGTWSHVISDALDDCHPFDLVEITRQITKMGMVNKEINEQANNLIDQIGNYAVEHCGCKKENWSLSKPNTPGYSLYDKI
jgi:hypothetical protein